MDVTEIEENLFAATDAKVLVQCLDWIQITGSFYCEKCYLSISLFTYSFMFLVGGDTILYTWGWLMYFHNSKYIGCACMCVCPPFFLRIYVCACPIMVI